jgi:hypothetical protein
MELLNQLYSLQCVSMIKIIKISTMLFCGFVLINLSDNVTQLSINSF